MKRTTAVTNFKVVFILALTCILSFCNSNNTRLVDILTPPVVIIVKNDSVVIVQGINNEKCIVNTMDKIDYRIAFLKVGDTLDIK